MMGAMFLVPVVTFHALLDVRPPRNGSLLGEFTSAYGQAAGKRNNVAQKQRTVGIDGGGTGGGGLRVPLQSIQDQPLEPSNLRLGLCPEGRTNNIIYIYVIKTVKNLFSYFSFNLPG